ncbi:tRNA (guanine-N(7)-)-methyltransferase [Linum perenne]
MAAAKLALLSPSLSSFSKYSANFRRFSVKVNACFDATKQLTSPNLVTLEYADLNLPSALQDVGHVRLRQHVNPLSSSFSGVEDSSCGWRRGIQIQEITWAWKLGKNFIMCLISSSYGSTLILDATQHNSWSSELNRGHFIFANAAVSFSHLIASYPGPLTLVSILCPDPHFKKRHHKRRVVQKPLVASILDNLVPGGKVFVQSDVLEVALAMRNQFDTESDMLQHVDEIDSSLQCDENGWLVNNPMGIRTEREIHAESEGATIYRRLYQKRTKLNK